LLAHRQSFPAEWSIPTASTPAVEEEVKEDSPAAPDIQNRRTTTKILDKWLLDLSNRIFAATEFI
jgi:hypothetical protein